MSKTYISWERKNREQSIADQQAVKKKQNRKNKGKRSETEKDDT